MDFFLFASCPQIEIRGRQLQQNYIHIAFLIHAVEKTQVGQLYYYLSIILHSFSVSNKIPNDLMQWIKHTHMKAWDNLFIYSTSRAPIIDKSRKSPKTQYIKHLWHWFILTFWKPETLVDTIEDELNHVKVINYWIIVCSRHAHGWLIHTTIILSFFV